MQAATTRRKTGPAGRARWRIALAALLLAGLAGLIVFGPSPREWVDWLAEGRTDWRAWSENRPWLAASGFALFYAAAVTLSLPGALWFTLAAGFLFGPVIAVPASLAGATLGATNIFLIAKGLAGRGFSDRFDGRAQKLVEGFRRGAFTWMIILRMVPAPFFAVNVAAALADIRLRDYVLGTLIGAIPATILYASLGSALGGAAEQGFSLSWRDALRPDVLTAAAFAIGLAFAPLLRHAFLQRRRPRT